MSDKPARILAIARAYPQLGIDGLRAGQIAAEVTSLHDACEAASRRFTASGLAQFEALFTVPALETERHDQA
ncbi:MAG: hypothetical protein RIS90_1906 [Pseudomonadota bacterium]|jgi:hypothetical protein